MSSMSTLELEASTTARLLYLSEFIKAPTPISNLTKRLAKETKKNIYIIYFLGWVNKPNSSVFASYSEKLVDRHL